MKNKSLILKKIEGLAGPAIFALVAIGSIDSLEAANYQSTVIGLAPTYYYELNETDATGGARDTMGNAPANGVFEGFYDVGPPVAGGPGAIEVFGGIAVPGLGGEDNRAHYSNNAGHITLGAGALFGSKAITVSLFLKAGPAQGGDRIFTNNVTDATTSFQIVTANDGLVLAVDPNGAGETAERTLFLEDNSEPDRRLINAESGWFHVVASTEGETGADRAGNFRLWINGVERTANLQPNVTGWGTDTGLAKIGGRRADPADSTTHSGAQDEVAIWLNRVLTEEEVATIWDSAINEKVIPLEFTDFQKEVDEGGQTIMTVTWRSKPNFEYIVASSFDLIHWNEFTDDYPTGGDFTTYVDDTVPTGTQRIYYRVHEGERVRP